MAETAEPTIRITEKAGEKIKTLVGTNQEKGLRIFIDAGGCSGMSYGMEISAEKPGDEHLEQFGVNVFLDDTAQTVLKGSEIDYSDALTSTGFQIRNPNAKQTCGCGKSFEA